MNANQPTENVTPAPVGSGHLVLLRVPRKSYDTGKHQWSYGTPIRFDSWDRSPSHWMRGPCPNCGSPTSTYGGGWTCHDDYCPSSANQFACSAGPAPDWWETQVNVFHDGDAWCATLDGFVNLQESVAGFGKTPRDAVSDLLQNVKMSHAAPFDPVVTEEQRAALALAPCSATIGVYVTLRGVRYRLQYASRDLAAQGIRYARRQGGEDINVFDPWLPKTPRKPNAEGETRRPSAPSAP